MKTLLADRHDDGKSRIDFLLTELATGELRAQVRVSGSGTMDGANALVRFLDLAIRAQNTGKANALMDLSDAKDSPIRAQFLLGKWLLTNKSRVGQVAVVGAKPWERKLATFVITFARLDTVAFHEQAPSALRWLGWES